MLGILEWPSDVCCHMCSISFDWPLLSVVACDDCIKHCLGALLAYCLRLELTWKDGFLIFHWGCILRGIWISEKQPLAATRSHSSGRKWPQVAALSSGRKWPQVAAFDAWPRCFNLIKSSHLQPLAATCSHLQPLEWPQVAAFPEWPQVAASGRSVEWPQLTASGRLRRVAEVFQSHKKQPLAAPTRVAASGRFSRVAASGREWPPLPHNVMNSKLRKTPTRSRRQPTYPSQLEKKHLSNKTYFFKMFIGKEDEWLDTSLSSKGQA